MRKILLFLMLFAALATAQEGAGEKKPLRGGFYFDLSLGAVIRHLEADYKTYLDNNYKDQYLGYTGQGGLVSTRFGGIIRGTVAIYGNIKLEITSGQNSGWKKDTRPTQSFFISNGPGVTVFPLSHSDGYFRNWYIGSTGNITLGGGGDIGFFGFSATFETGLLWDTSERYCSGFAIGTDVVGTAGLNDYYNEKGKSVWIAFKLIRK